MNLMIIVICLLLSCSNPSTNEHSVVKGVIEGDNEKYSLSYSIMNGYNVSVEIKDIKGQKLFNKRFETDISRVGANFVDLNNDKRKDIILKLFDESGYQLLILMNMSDRFIICENENIYIRLVNDSTIIGENESITVYHNNGRALIKIKNVIAGNEIFDERVYVVNKLFKLQLMKTTKPKILLMGDEL